MHAHLLLVVKGGLRACPYEMKGENISYGISAELFTSTLPVDSCVTLDRSQRRGTQNTCIIWKRRILQYPIVLGRLHVLQIITTRGPLPWDRRGRHQFPMATSLNTYAGSTPLVLLMAFHVREGKH